MPLEPVGTADLFAGESWHWVLQIIVVFHTLLSSAYLFSFCEWSYSNTFPLACGESALVSIVLLKWEFRALHLLACALQFWPLKVNYQDFQWLGLRTLNTGVGGLRSRMLLAVANNKNLLPCHRSSRKRIVLSVYPYVDHLGQQSLCKWPNTCQVINDNRSTTLNEIFWPVDFFKLSLDIILVLEVARLVRVPI